MFVLYCVSEHRPKSCIMLISRTNRQHEKEKDYKKNYITKGRVLVKDSRKHADKTSGNTKGVQIIFS